jgi:hypothetical protein
VEQLANSQRHLLMAQPLMNNRMDRAESAVQKLAEQNVKLAETVQAVAEKFDGVADQLDALTTIVRQWYERHGNGSSGQQSS